MATKNDQSTPAGRQIAFARYFLILQDQLDESLHAFQKMEYGQMRVSMEDMYNTLCTAASHWQDIEKDLI